MMKKIFNKTCKEHLLFLAIMFAISEAIFFLLYALPENAESILTTILCGIIWTAICYIYEFYIKKYV